MNGVERSNDGVTLRKCPFCGGDNVGIWENKPIAPIVPTTYEVRCYDCHFGYVQRKTKEEAVEAWNNRRPIENVLERLEEESYWTPSTYDADGYCNDDSEEVIGLDKAIEIIKEEVG